MAGEETTNQGNIKVEYNQATTGINMDNTVNQISKGSLTYALNGAVENFDSNSVNYQNEPGNEFCVSFPDGYQLIGEHAILEQNKHIFFLANPITGESEIGYMDNNDCVYRTYINAVCLNFDINHPIHKAVHKITNCTTEIYWTDGINPRRFLDLVNLPYTTDPTTSVCDGRTLPTIDCNKLNIQPDFTIPQLEVINIINGGDLKAGTYQFAIQYCDSIGDGYTSFYSVTNPTPIANINITTPSFDYAVGRSIVLNISNIDVTGYFKYYNLAVIKTVNNISSVELVGTYFIDNLTQQITYTGQNVTSIKLTINEIFEKFPYYEIAQDLTAVQDVLVWDNLTSLDKVNYQSIANRITVGWETYRIPDTENYADELNATNLRGYLRDEVYAFEIVFLLNNGRQTEGFHIPGREKGIREVVPDIPTTNNDFIGEPDYYVPTSGGIDTGYSPYWKIYNTASVSGYTDEYLNALSSGVNMANYKGSYQYGEMGYWESIEDYPCNVGIWGTLSNQKIRHHKFPDVLVSPIYESGTFSLSGGSFSPVYQGTNAVYALGLRIDTLQIKQLIQLSSLTQEQKDNIAGFKIVRGDRGTNKSVIAKGILRNIGQYTRQEQTYYFPNYPYNDLNDDPFLLTANNAFSKNSEAWLITTYGNDVVIGYTDRNSGKLTERIIPANTKDKEICSLTRPITKRTIGGNRFALIGPAHYYLWNVSSNQQGFNAAGTYAVWDDPFTDDNTSSKHHDDWISGGLFNLSGAPDYVVARTLPEAQYEPQNRPPCGCGALINFDPCCWVNHDLFVSLKSERVATLNCKADAPPENVRKTQDPYGDRVIFNSPETSFGQPFLGDVLKLESTMFGAGKGHFVLVNNNANYKLLSKEAQKDALGSSQDLANVVQFDPTAMFTAYQAYLQIYINGITRKNYAYSFNSIAHYNYTQAIPNNQGNKQRNLDIAQYLIPGVQNVGDTYNVNNYQRESSVYLRTPSNYYGLDRNRLEFPDYFLNDSTGTPIVTDESRYTIGSSITCPTPALESPISVVSYYASIKNSFPSQWGQMYTYDTIDTGFQIDLNKSKLGIDVVFGGDTFISNFAFKTKLPFFIDNRVNAPDDSDIFYDEIGNIAYPKYWHTSRSILDNFNVQTNGGSGSSLLINVISYKDHVFDCPNDPASIVSGPGAPSTERTYYDGYFYLFAYGVPSFYCESSYNVDLRQAFNNKEGDFWPHVSTGIPDDWVQESFVSIANDNTYHYNVTYSKQNKENYFAHLPIDWQQQLCFTNFPFRAIYSDRQQSFSDNKINSWLIYRPISFFDFPQNYGKLTSLDGIQNRAILARFENKSLLYNTLLTVDTSNPQAAYLGNDTLFKSSPPIDFAETDLGYVGSQNKMLLKIPQGQVTIDAKRGQVFLVTGNQATDLSAFGSGMNRFFTDHLAFEILRYFPDVDTDNHFNGIGLHGVYDSKFDRVIISKLDYIPLHKNIFYDPITREFFKEEVLGVKTLRFQVYLTDPQYFCNKSWTLSFNMNTKSWISFHSYIPNFYIAENNFFYSGLNGCCDDLEVIAINEVPVTTTSSTTSAIITTTTSSSTTLCITCKPSPPPCSIEAYAQETDCVLDGIVYDLSPTTTTTTTCNLSSLNTYIFYTGYTISPNAPVDSTGSKDDACSAISATQIEGSFSSTKSSIIVNGSSLTPGVVLYYGQTCNVVPDGWYFTDSSTGDFLVYNVVSGFLVSVESCVCPTTTTTTTGIPSIAECGAFFIASTDGIYYSGTGSKLNIIGYDATTAYGIANTTSKFWSVDTNFNEWNITLSPFGANFSRTIAFPAGFTTTMGIAAISNTKLIAVNTTPSPYEIVEIDICSITPTITTKIVLPTDRDVIGNPLYLSGKLLVITKDVMTSIYYVSQYDYDTGALEVEIDTTGLVVADLIFITLASCNLILGDVNGTLYQLGTVSPYTIVQGIDFTTLTINGISPLPSCQQCCSTPGLITTTTTSTTV